MSFEPSSIFDVDRKRATRQRLTAHLLEPFDPVFFGLPRECCKQVLHFWASRAAVWPLHIRRLSLHDSRRVRHSCSDPPELSIKKTSTWAKKGQPIRIWARKGQPIRIWAKKGQPIRIWAKKGQPIRIWAKKGQPIRIWAKKGQPIRNRARKGQPIRIWAKKGQLIRNLVNQSEIGPKSRWAQCGPK